MKQLLVHSQLRESTFVHSVDLCDEDEVIAVYVHCF